MLHMKTNEIAIKGDIFTGCHKLKEVYMVPEQCRNIVCDLPRKAVICNPNEK